MTEAFANVNGARLWYEDIGEGPAVLLLHSHAIDSRQWDTQMEPFAREHRVVRFDGRGFGRSSAAEGDFSFVDDLRGMMGHLGIERAALVGGSGSGATIIEMALAHPEAVAALVPVGTALPGHSMGDTPPQGVVDMVGALQRGDVDAATEFALSLYVDGGRTIEQVDAAARERNRELIAHRFSLPGGPVAGRRLDPPAATRLGEIAAPMLVVIGANDHPALHAISERLEREVPGARRLVIADAGHHPNMEHPDEFNAAVLEFLRSA